MANIYEVQVHIPTNISIKKSIFKLYILWKDLTPRVFQLFGQCLPLYHCATLIHMIIGQKFWYLKLLFVIQTWQIYMNFRYIYLQTYDQKEWKDLTPRVFPLFIYSAPSSCRTGDSNSCLPANGTESYAKWPT